MAETDVVAVLASALSCTYWPAFPTSGLMRRSKQPLHSITSPARPRGVDEVVFADNALPVCVTIGEILRAFTPTECANYFRNSGYAQS